MSASSWYESLVDRQIREAQEQGEFDNLPGSGKPIPGQGEPYDENWWIKGLIHREQLAGLAPTSLTIRKEADELMATLAGKSSEPVVRDIVAKLNERIELARRSMVDGPPVVIEAFDVGEVVARWRRARTGEQDGAGRR